MVIGNRQGVAILMILQHELAFVVGTPKIVWLRDMLKRCADGFVSFLFVAFYKPMPIENAVNRALSW